MRNNLFIGLNGYAGAGKDTVAKMLKVLLNNQWNSYDEYKKYFDGYYSNDNGIQYATFSNLDRDNSRVMTIAFADQLKQICSSMFGIPIKHFYYNKANSWVNINGDFEFTQIMPDKANIITAQEYYCNLDYYNSNHDTKYWMSLREILVYVGTYMCQADINDSIFINIVNNKIREEDQTNKNLNYILITDVRFVHELEYIKNHGGIVINITRNSVEQLDNIAEHDLDEVDEYDFTIDNSGTYDDLLLKVWNMVHDNVIFQNTTIPLDTRYNTNNYIRLIKNDNDVYIWKLYTEFGTLRTHKVEGNTIMIDPTGGPMISVGNEIYNTSFKVQSITFDNGWLIDTIKTS